MHFLLIFAFQVCGDGVYTADAIIGHHVENGRVFYETTWEGYTDITAEPSEHFESFRLIEEYFINKLSKFEK